MTYTITILPSVQKVIDKLAVADAARVIKTISALAANPRPHGCIKLEDRKGWRVRAGDIRILYEINDTDLVVIIIRVARRDKVYK